MSAINNMKANEHDIAIECSKVRKCKWKGMHSDLVGVPHKNIANAMQLVCPACGCDSYYKREPRVTAQPGEKTA